MNDLNNNIYYAKKTIQDFGKQWFYYKKWDIYKDSNDSNEFFEDIITPLLKPAELKDKTIVDIGSGNGRLINPLLAFGAKHIVAIEPSDAYHILKYNIINPDKVTCLQITGDKIPPYYKVDFVFCIGVIHHIPDYKPVINAAYNALRDGGRIFIELYSKEGNMLYLTLLRLLRFITVRLPDNLLRIIVKLLDPLVATYVHLASRFPLPLSSYCPIIRKLKPHGRQVLIFDQLNPTYTKYYTHEEAMNILKDKFEDIQIYHRRRYSWIVLGTKRMV